MSGFTHFDQKGNAVMVDVHEKADTYRVAVAAGTITVNEEVFQAITNHTAKKGDVLGIARIAGIMGAEKKFRADSVVPHYCIDRLRDFF